MGSPLNMTSTKWGRESRGMKLTVKRPLPRERTEFFIIPRFTMISSWPSPAWDTSTARHVTHWMYHCQCHKISLRILWQFWHLVIQIRILLFFTSLCSCCIVSKQPRGAAPQNSFLSFYHKILFPHPCPPPNSTKNGSRRLYCLYCSISFIKSDLLQSQVVWSGT